jgi:hypothetical protein
MVDDAGQVAVAAAVREIVDPDPLQAGELVATGERLTGDALADRADAAPRDPHQLSNRLLGDVDREPADLVLERGREPRVVTRPRNPRDDDLVALATHAGRIGLQVRERRTEIQCSPQPAALPRVLARAAPPANPAPVLLSRRRADRHDDRLVVLQAHVLDDRPLDAEQHLPYPSTAHATCLRFTSS